MVHGMEYRHSVNPCESHIRRFPRKNLNRKPWFLPSNWSGFPVKIFPSSNSMIYSMVFFGCEGFGGCFLTWVISHVPILHITQPLGINGLLDGYYFWWCPKWDGYPRINEPASQLLNQCFPTPFSEWWWFYRLDALDSHININTTWF